MPYLLQSPQSLLLFTKYNYKFLCTSSVFFLPKNVHQFVFQIKPFSFQIVL